MSEAGGALRGPQHPPLAESEYLGSPPEHQQILKAPAAEEKKAKCYQY